MSKLKAIQGVINGQQFDLYFKDEVDKLLAELRENNKKAYDKQEKNWNRLCVKYNKLIELKKEFCEKFVDIVQEIDK